MPFVNIHIGKVITHDVKDALANRIAESMPIIPGKNRDNTMIEISDGRDMYMFGGRADIIFTEIRVYQEISIEIKRAFVMRLADVFAEILGIPESRQYFNIMEMPEWGVGSRYLV